MNNFFQKFKLKFAEDRLTNERLHQFVLEEIEKGIINKDLWGLAVEKSKGNENLIESIYIKLRTQKNSGRKLCFRSFE